MKVIAQRGESVLADLDDADDGGLFQIRRGCVVNVGRRTVSGAAEHQLDTGARVGGAVHGDPEPVLAIVRT